MTASIHFREIAELVALALLAAAFLVTVLRVIIGPTLPDRVLGLDMLVSAVIGFIAVLGIKTGYPLFVDIAIALGLVGFLATVAFARFIASQYQVDAEGAEEKHVGTRPENGR
jgi:multicomponent Na+:H+ antiporter subunit F